MIEFIKNALAEDVGSGDYTTISCVSIDSKSNAQLLVKKSGVIAGVECAKQIINYYDSSLRVESFTKDGDDVSAGDIVFIVSGSTRSILTTERLVLNVMQRMSGVATTTSQYAKAISHTKAKVLDTRKTTPGMRFLEKQAVRIGGGINHRTGLYDMILIKDNHIDAAGGMSAAIKKAIAFREIKDLQIEIEVEVRSLIELEEALLHTGVSRIMLDNFTPIETMEAVKIVNGRCCLESSGGIILETVASYAETGVDYISVGALTHSVKALDLSLKIIL